MNASKHVEHFFRHEYGKVVAVLCRRVGMHHLALVEDSVQVALMTGLETWTKNGLPDNPSAWLYKVAWNKLIEKLRQQMRQGALVAQQAQLQTCWQQNTQDQPAWQTDDDDLLFMLLACCNQSIPMESQLVLALKAVCGFSIEEIALRLFITQANAYKRFSRAKGGFKNQASNVWEQDIQVDEQRLSALRKLLYLIFTEGYLSLGHGASIRQELCEEAIRLTSILANNRFGKDPETFALLALMHLQAARIAARQDSSGGLLLLEQQDRCLWNQKMIETGLRWLQHSSSGGHFSRYHAEAGIAAEHCMAKSFELTRWDRIIESYVLLEQEAPSPLHRLNRAVAVAQWQGAAAGLAVIEGFQPPSWLVGCYQWSAVLAYLYRCNNEQDKANQYQELALGLAPTEALKALISNRFETM